MLGQLSCRLCGGRYKATAKNFPLVLYGDRDIIDKKTKRVVGKTRVIIGYACKKCAKKGRQQIAREREARR